MEIHQSKPLYKQTQRQKKHTIILFDAEKAFDKIQHLFIIKDLETSGIGGLILSLLECLAEYGLTLRAPFPYTSAAYISP